MAVTTDSRLPSRGGKIGCTPGAGARLPQRPKRLVSAAARVAWARRPARHKGSMARSGHGGPGGGKPHFEGGQMPMTRRIPKRGFTNPFREENQVVRLSDLALLPEGTEVTPLSLHEAGLIRANKGAAKLLANGEITHAVTVGHKISTGDRQKIEAAEAREEYGAKPCKANPAAGSRTFATRELGTRSLHVPALRITDGAHITAPGVDVVGDGLLRNRTGGPPGLYDILWRRLSRATGSPSPNAVISASIFVQSPGRRSDDRQMQEDEEGRKKSSWTRYITVLLAVVQEWASRSHLVASDAVVDRASASKIRWCSSDPGAIGFMWLVAVRSAASANGASLIIFFSSSRLLKPGSSTPYASSAPARRTADAARARRVMVAVVLGGSALTMAAAA